MSPDDYSAPEDSIPIDELIADLVLDDSDDDVWGDVDDHDGTSAVLGVTIINWRSLGQGSPVDVAKAWTELESWVAWLVNRYDIPRETLPECWWKHGGTVEELSALHSCWQASFDESDSGYGPIGFHERLAVAKDRIRKSWPAGCSRTHTVTAARVLERPEEEWQKWITASHA